MTTLSLKNRLALYRLRGRGPVAGSPGCAVCGLPRPQGEGRGEGGSFSSREFSGPDDIDLYYALGLPPEKAIAYFKSKGYAFSWDWHDVWQEAQALSFTVAKAMRLDVLQTIRDEVQKVFDEGITLDQFRKELEPKLRELGWWGRVNVGDETGAESVQLGSPYRLKTIYNTNMQTALNAGRERFDLENTGDRPYWRYVAVMDAATRPSHRALHGKVFPADDPFWNSFYPPNGWGCRCRVQALSERDVKKMGLFVGSSEGTLSEKDALISNKTGELRPVAVYADPVTGAKISPDPGWSYNPGTVDWTPDLGKYDKDIAKLF